MPTLDPLRPLLDASLEGDDSALAELVRRTQPLVWRLCSALGSAGEVEDLVQDVYARALAALPTYRGEAPVVAWLISIARRVCADSVRRRQHQRRLFSRLTASAEATTTVRSDPIDDLLKVLDTDRRAAFVLTQLLGFSYEDAATALGCPIGTIRSRVARARADLIGATRRAEAQ